MEIVLGSRLFEKAEFGEESELEKVVWFRPSMIINNFFERKMSSMKLIVAIDKGIKEI